MKTYTLKSDYTDRKAVIMELRTKFPGMVIWNEFYPHSKPSNRIAVRVYCHRWHGEWTGYVREHYCNLYECACV